MTTVENSCFKRMTLNGKTQMNVWSLELFVSPDNRFISTDLMDLGEDPVLAEIKKDQETMNRLSQGTVPWRGRMDAPVTIIEFSDFQCPYCRGFSNLLKSELKNHPESVRVVFRNLPLSIHDWAKPAAEGAACGLLQGQEAFWKIHDRLFADQDKITNENIRGHLISAALDEHLNVDEFVKCLDNQLSTGLVLRDVKAASLYQVAGTPTIFLNGERVDQPVQDVQSLHALVEAAQKRMEDVRIKNAASSGAMVSVRNPSGPR